MHAKMKMQANMQAKMNQANMKLQVKMHAKCCMHIMMVFMQHHSPLDLRAV